MKLHEAIEKVLLQFGHPMTTQEIANELNKNKWYQKKDRSEISAFQIHGRTRNYSHMFSRDGNKVKLIGKEAALKSVKKVIKSNSVKPVSEIRNVNVELLEKILMNEKNFRNAKEIDGKVSNNPGLYCIRIAKTENLPNPFNRIINERNHNIVYIGIASESLSKRILNQELRAKGHGTFFRSIGAILGFRPPKGSLVDRKNKRNYTFSHSDESKIIGWINNNLIVNWVEYSEELDNLETKLIVKYLPLLNIAKNPMALKEVSDLRAECVKIANEKS
jgi:hypothetical protein